MTTNQHPKDWNEAHEWLKANTLEMIDAPNGWMKCDCLSVLGHTPLTYYRRKPEEKKLLEFWAYVMLQDPSSETVKLGNLWKSESRAKQAGNPTHDIRHFREVPPPLTDKEIEEMTRNAILNPDDKAPSSEEAFTRSILAQLAAMGRHT